MFTKFSLKDISFIAVFSAVLLIVSGLIMPIVMFTQIFALRQLVAAPIFALFCTVALKKVPKLGTMTLIGLFTGGVLAFMSIAMLLNNLLAAVIVELLVIIFFRNYDKKASRIFAAAMYMPLSLPINLLANWALKNQSIASQLANWQSVILVSLATVALGFVGAYIGNRIAIELRKAGKI